MCVTWPWKDIGSLLRRSQEVRVAITRGRVAAGAEERCRVQKCLKLGICVASSSVGDGDGAASACGWACDDRNLQ
jgi:hypothetical protein